MGTVAKHVEMPALPPGAPGLFRCAAAGYMAGVFRDAGLRNVTEKEVGAPVLTKPFSQSELADKVREILGRPPGPPRNVD